MEGKLKIAIGGTGRVSRRHVIETLEQVIDGCEELIISMPADMESDASSAARYAADWAVDSNVEFGLSIAKGKRSEYVDGLADAAQSIYASANAARALEPGDVIYLAWDDSDDLCMRTLMSASKLGVIVLDLTNDNDPIILDDDEVGDPAPFPEGTPTVGGDRDELDVFVDNREVMKRVQRILDRAMGDVQSVLSEYIESAPAPRKNRRATRTNL